MKIRSLVAAANIGFMFLLVVGIEAEATELKLLSSVGMQTVMEDLGPKVRAHDRTQAYDHVRQQPEGL
jgi:hypothetical protein